MKVGELGTDQAGAVLVMVTLWMTVFIGMVGFVLETGNWWTHRKHLQMQADAAALAGAGGFVVPCADQAVIDEATKYSGTPGSLYNEQIGGTPQTNVHMLVNSATWYNQATPIDSTVDPNPPCAARMLDVKLTETDLPYFFKPFAVPFINAHARIMIKQVTTRRGALPVAVPDVNPKSVKAVFIDETTGATIAETPLSQAAGGGTSLVTWDNAMAPLPVNIDRSKIGVRIVLSGNESSSNCGDPLVECYDTGSANGLLSVRGWDPSISGAQPDSPALREAKLVNGSCTSGDGYFSADTTTCNIGITARVDFGSLAPADARLNAVLGNKRYPLDDADGDGVWASATDIPMPAGVGPTGITLDWEERAGTWNGQTCTSGNNTPCKGSFGVVQRHFSASDARSGPIRYVSVTKATDATEANSLPTGAAEGLVVSVQIKGNLGYATSVDDPVVELRVAGGGSQNQSLDCDPDSPDPELTNSSTLKDELWIGCSKGYTVNNGTTCPSTAPALWGSPQPWNCVAMQTGAATNQVPAGLNLRVLGEAKPASCTSPNNWQDFPNIPNDDPRIVPVFITPYGTFSGSGSAVVPITGFATFYVTGWGSSGAGFANPCTGAGDDLPPDSRSGYIYGHFIKYVQTLNDGSGGEELCDYGALGSCIAQLSE